MTMNYGFKINGYTDSHTQCDRCGKTNLKGTYNIDTEDGGNFHLGSSCIKKAWQMNQKEFTAKVKSDEQERVNAGRKEFRESEVGKSYQAYLGSDEHKADIQNGGFSLVWTKIEAAMNFEKELKVKYNVKRVLS